MPMITLTGVSNEQASIDQSALVRLIPRATILESNQSKRIYQSASCAGSIDTTTCAGMCAHAMAILV